MYKSFCVTVCIHTNSTYSMPGNYDKEEKFESYEAYPCATVDGKTLCSFAQYFSVSPQV